MIIKMTKVQIYGPKELIDPVTSGLYDLGVLHIEQLPPSMASLVTVRDRMTEDKELIRQRVDLEGILDRVTKSLVLLPRPPKTGGPADSQPITGGKKPEELGDMVEEVYRSTESVFAEQKSIKDRIDLLKKYEKMIKALAPIVDDVADTQHLEMVGLTIEKKNEGIIKLIEEELFRITGDSFHIFTSEVDKDTLAAVLAFGKSHAPRIRELLWEQNLNEIKLPSELQNMPLKDALQSISLQAEKLPAELIKVEQEIDHLAKRWYHPLAQLKEQLIGKLQQMTASATFLKTHYSFVIAGWLPKRSFPKLVEQMEKKFGGKVVVEEVPLTAEDLDNIPVHMVNPPLIRPFEVFVKLLPLPVYGTVDPTPFFFFFFPIFFGFILGDAGYGLVALILSLIMRKKLKAGTTMHQIFTVLLYSSVMAILFGIAFGEFFGELGEFFPGPFAMRPWRVAGHTLHRLHEIPMFLGIAVVVGAIHVFLGIALGMVNAIWTHHRKHLVFKVGQFASLLSLLVVIAILAGLVDRVFLWPTVAILAAGLVTITVTEGFIAPIEILSAVGNILSYARLMAIGLSSVILAMVANEMGRMSNNLFVGILIASVFHLINIVLGIFSPTIHSMRLHLVEFFGKFYETGGAEYKPFKRHGGE